MLFQLEKTRLIQVAIPLPIDDPFTYMLPDDWGDVKPGMRVMVPFKNREMTGYIVGVDEDIPKERTKRAIKLLDEEPLLSEHFLKLTRWMKDYYFSSWGEAIEAAIPKFYRDGKSTRKIIDEILTDEFSDPKLHQLNDEQKNAVDQISNFIASNQYHSVLLFGVTGSGKSEVYIRSIQKAIQCGKQAICLVPEIALTEQLKMFFASHFQDQLEIVHSKLSEGERWQAWQRIRSGKKQVILGPRSAVFSPIPNLGLIIMDEEHESSYKQDQSPRYHAREVADWRARNSNAVFMMGSATPSLETMQKTQSSGPIVRLDLTKRVDAKKMPVIEIVDLNLHRGGIISSKLQTEIQKALDRKESVMLLLNRRGFSTQVHCLYCKELLMCRFCDVALTYHQQDQSAICHYCNFKIDKVNSCPKCKNVLLKFSGIGTEKVESETARFFPSARIARLDSDTVRRKNSHQKILKDFRDQKIDILVGTQMIAKGFDFPHVTVVGVVLADTALSLPDFRSSEKTFQLLTQVAGRGGRGAKEARVIIQTYSPLHYSIQRAKNHDSLGFFDEEIKNREVYHYPPFLELINIIFRGKSEEKVIEQAVELKQQLEKQGISQNIEILGPAPLPFRKLRGHFRWHLMIKTSGGSQPTQTVLRAALKEMRRISTVLFAVDRDPLAIL